MVVSFVLIPSDSSTTLQTLLFEPSHKNDRKTLVGDQLSCYLQNQIKGSDQQIQVTPLKRIEDNVSPSTAGVYAYYVHNNENQAIGNKRATILAMACGLLSRRFWGDVYISRLGYFTDGENECRHLKNLSITSEDIKIACFAGPDLRVGSLSANYSNINHNDIKLPNWLVNAAKSNYEDSASLNALVSITKSEKNVDTAVSQNSLDNDIHNDVVTYLRKDKKNDFIQIEPTKLDTDQAVRKALKTKPLCLHCHRPTDTLCPDCGAAYFCDAPRTCITDCWSHQCVCQTWSLYTQRWKSLTKFPFLHWHLPLVERKYMGSNSPYKKYLKNVLCVLYDDSSPITRADLWWDTNIMSWWETEIDNWECGMSDSAQIVDPSIRRSYKQGFRLDEIMIPKEQRVTNIDTALSMIERDKCNLLKLNTWKAYYILRKIPLMSPVALLCTFPLTVYYSIQRYGSVPITVAKMLKRPMRLHVIGIEKELNFLDLFKEVGFLLPHDIMIEMVFIVRADMLPPRCKPESHAQKHLMKLELTQNVSLTVQTGTYAETIDPNFDCGSGPPDMIIAMNADLLADESWRSVIEFLKINSGVVGVMSCCSESIGVNSSSLGGWKSRESLCINPFRQPRVMPVYSMNLPQLSNGFIYVYNEQELDI